MPPHHPSPVPSSPTPPLPILPALSTPFCAICCLRAPPRTSCMPPSPTVLHSARLKHWTSTRRCSRLRPPSASIYRPAGVPIHVCTPSLLTPAVRRLLQLNLCSHRYVQGVGEPSSPPSLACPSSTPSIHPLTPPTAESGYVVASLGQGAPARANPPLFVIICVHPDITLRILNRFTPIDLRRKLDEVLCRVRHRQERKRGRHTARWYRVHLVRAASSGRHRWAGHGRCAALESPLGCSPVTSAWTGGGGATWRGACGWRVGRTRPAHSWISRKWPLGAWTALQVATYSGMARPAVRSGERPWNVECQSFIVDLVRGLFIESRLSEVRVRAAESAGRANMNS